MKTTVTLSLALAATLLINVSAQARWVGSASSKFAVKATMDSFVGTAASEPIVLADGATEFPVTFQIAKLETGKKKRDVEMQHMFHADQHPEIVGTAKVDEVMKPKETGELPVTLTIAGVTQTLTAKISEVVLTDGQLNFTAYLEISLKSFGLKPPSIMKIINVGDLVKVTTTFTLAQTAQPE